MAAEITALENVTSDSPVPLLSRQLIRGEQSLVAFVTLEKGCVVAMHAHESEQIAYIVSGRVKWMLGDTNTPEYREQIVEGGTVVRLPSNFPHGVEALEQTVIIDILSPPGPMGVDHQKSEPTAH